MLEKQTLAKIKVTVLFLFKCRYMQIYVPSSAKLFWSLSSELFLLQGQQTFGAENSQDFLVYQVKKTKTKTNQ